MKCQNCYEDMLLVDSTFSSRTKKQTGDIYYCEKDERYYLYVFESCMLEDWVY